MEVGHLRLRGEEAEQVEKVGHLHLGREDSEDAEDGGAENELVVVVLVDQVRQEEQEGKG